MSPGEVTRGAEPPPKGIVRRSVSRWPAAATLPLTANGRSRAKIATSLVAIGTMNVLPEGAI